MEKTFKLTLNNETQEVEAECDNINVIDLSIALACAMQENEDVRLSVSAALQILASGSLQTKSELLDK